MNDLVSPLFWSAAQVTCLALGGDLGAVLVGRRSPAAAASVLAVTLSLCVVLTVLAVVPLPGWRSWTAGATPTPRPKPVQVADNEPMPSQGDVEAPTTQESVPPGTAPGIDLRRLLSSVRPRVTATEPQ